MSKSLAMLSTLFISATFAAAPPELHLNATLVSLEIPQEADLVMTLECTGRLPGPEGLFTESVVLRFAGSAETTTGKPAFLRITAEFETTMAGAPHPARSTGDIHHFEEKTGIAMIELSSVRPDGTRQAVITRINTEPKWTLQLHSGLLKWIPEADLPRWIAGLHHMLAADRMPGGSNERLFCDPSYSACFNDAQAACHGSGLIVTNFTYKCIKLSGETTCQWTCGQGGSGR